MSTTAKRYLLQIYDVDGEPTYYRDMSGHGELHRAIYAHQHGDPIDQDQFDRIVDYCDYFVNAPCWALPLPDGTPRTIPAPDVLRVIRDSVRQIKTREDLDTWLAAALVAKLDPL